MAGFGSLGKIAKELARNPKVREALNSPQAKQMGSKVVDRVADVADKATKGKHQEKIQNARGQAQKHLRGPGEGPDANPNNPGSPRR
ncbi:Rv0909 family putative TA system antitoxin [Arthrobacter sp. D2-10]